MPMSKEKYKEYYKNYYQKNKKKLKEKTSKWREKNKDLYHLARIKERCKRDNIPFNLEREDFVWPDICPVLGIPLIRGDKVLHDNSPSIDRIDPNGGYVKGNVQIMSHKANAMKRNASVEDLLKFADWIYKTYG